MIPSARQVWRQGVVPQLSVEQLEFLRDALEKDDPALIQGATTSPPPLQCVQDWPVEAGCLISYPGWKSGRATVAEVEEWFARVCFVADTEIGEPAAVRYLLNWWDDSPRSKVVADLLAEVRLALRSRTDLQPKQRAEAALRKDYPDADPQSLQNMVVGWLSREVVELQSQKAALEERINNIFTDLG